ncbi:GGDEF domain-containing protein [Nodularia harveyana UHCC-0300]|uniref:GGDEF domain-containing protein n=1 Tax=Nodularia harveyana UHCC-0300 TaxID=2974287 RepID=A0ABU5UIJ2_9CYAN|nr:GGDEF domain-containing protein [Nodularia harveyana]MEA5583128.1 GGDEF domain-containing protein [Nodularia harveyana UHCC-0300]
MNSLEKLQRNSIKTTLWMMVLGGIIASIFHLSVTETHLISLVIPPLTIIVGLGLLIYLHRYPDHIHQVIKIIFGWSSVVLFFPEYFFVIEAIFNPEKKLVDTLPPISSGIFFFTTGMIVFARLRNPVRIASLLWLFSAFPIVIYLLFFPEELKTPRGLDLMMTFVPNMGMNLCLITFYERLQDSVDQLQTQQLHLQEVAEKDALTGIFNRGKGERILQNLIERPDRNIGIILCDIDHFKRVNDNFGHLVGDRVLQEIVKCFQAHIRQEDVLVRWGGEEFLIVVSENDEIELKQLAERLREIIAEHKISEVGNMTASFGVARLNSSENLKQLFSRADQALYKAKKLGRNQVVIA